MPDITTTGLVDYETPGFEFLLDNNKVALAFSGATLPTNLDVGFRDDNGNFVAFDDGAVTALPRSMVVNCAPPGGVVLNVSGGSPDFNCSNAGPAGDVR